MRVRRRHGDGTGPVTTSRRKVSPLRLLTVVALSLGCLSLVALWLTRTVETALTTRSTVRFAPYVDVTLTPVMHFEDPLENPVGGAVLSFVVSDHDDPCAPSWGNYYSLDAASRALDLDRRVVRTRERQGEVIVSFGGAINDELARGCTDVGQLTDAYRSVIDRYGVSTLDFDIEGDAIGDRAANERRATALRRLQDEPRGTPLEIWLTLPVAPTGITDASVALLDTTLAAGVDLAGVNVMTMDYGGSRPQGQSMYEASAAALESTWRQLDAAYRRAGVVLSAEQVWARVGATPMIGQNDVASERFSLDDARRLVVFAQDRGLGRLSMWSANRDGPCGVQVDGPAVSNTCSGVDQEPAEFARTLSSAHAKGQVATEATAAPSESRDDPATSPYPIWRETKEYVVGDKIVWHRAVYEAKWWSQGDLPDGPVTNLWETPWRYLGPVLPEDSATTSTTRLPGTWPRWSENRVYVEGDEVVHLGQLYRARWWTQGDEPLEDPDRAFDHPWDHLGAAPPTTTAAESASDG